MPESSPLLDLQDECLACICQKAGLDGLYALTETCKCLCKRVRSVLPLTLKLFSCEGSELKEVPLDRTFTGATSLQYNLLFQDGLYVDSSRKRPTAEEKAEEAREAAKSLGDALQYAEHLPQLREVAIRVQQLPEEWLDEEEYADREFEIEPEVEIAGAGLELQLPLLQQLTQLQTIDLYVVEVTPAVVEALAGCHPGANIRLSAHHLNHNAIMAAGDSDSNTATPRTSAAAGSTSTGAAVRVPPCAAVAAGTATSSSRGLLSQLSSLLHLKVELPFLPDSRDLYKHPSWDSSSSSSSSSRCHLPTSLTSLELTASSELIHWKPDIAACSQLQQLKLKYRITEYDERRHRHPPISGEAHPSVLLSEWPSQLTVLTHLEFAGVGSAVHIGFSGVHQDSVCEVKVPAAVSQLTGLRSISCCDGWQLQLCEREQWQALAALPALESLGEMQLVPPQATPVGPQAASSQQQQQQIVAVGPPREQLQVAQVPATPGLQLRALTGLTALMERAREQLPQLLEACPHLQKLELSFNQGGWNQAGASGRAAVPAGSMALVSTQLTSLCLKPRLVYATWPEVRKAEQREQAAQAAAAAQVVVEEMLQHCPALQDLSFQWPITHREDSPGCRLPHLNALTGLTRLVMEVNDIHMGPENPTLDDAVAMLAPLSQLRHVKLTALTVQVEEDFDFGDVAAGSPLDRRLAELGYLPHLETQSNYYSTKIDGVGYVRPSDYRTDSEDWSASEDSDSEGWWSSESDGY